ncbi:unnamed protein product, partial [marine sediment metagenome]
LVETFRPDYAVIDCALGPERSRDICNHLVEDPRVPFVRVIMAAELDELPNDCDKQIFATIEKPLQINKLADMPKNDEDQCCVEKPRKKPQYFVALEKAWEEECLSQN